MCQVQLQCETYRLRPRSLRREECKFRSTIRGLVRGYAFEAVFIHSILFAMSQTGLD
jgi:hypothetical protein